MESWRQLVEEQHETLRRVAEAATWGVFGKKPFRLGVPQTIEENPNRKTIGKPSENPNRRSDVNGWYLDAPSSSESQNMDDSRGPSVSDTSSTAGI